MEHLGSALKSTVQPKNIFFVAQVGIDSGLAHASLKEIAYQRCKLREVISKKPETRDIWSTLSVGGLIYP